MRDLCRADGAATVRLVFGALLVLLLPFGAAVPLDRAPVVQLIDRDPARGADLREGEPLYLRLRYRGAMPIHILIRGRYRGDVVRYFLQDSEELFPAGTPRRGAGGSTGSPGSCFQEPFWLPLHSFEQFLWRHGT
jgi:hypothetical protein